MKEAVAFFDQQISMAALSPKVANLPSLESMMEERVIDFRKEANNG
jgi:hypothetical protein